MKKYLLLDKNSPLYIKRMVREINRRLRAGNSVMARDYPFNVKVCGAYEPLKIKKVLVRLVNGKTGSYDVDSFFDADGNQICANRADA